MHVEVNVPIPYSADDVWSMAGGFNSLPAISSGCIGSVLEEGGRVRVLTNTDGSTLWERMLTFNEAEKTLSYLITDNKNFKSAYDVGYIGTVKIVEGDDKSCTFKYTGDFEPTPGTSDEQAEKAVQNFANDCAKGIERALKARGR